MPSSTSGGCESAARRSDSMVSSGVPGVVVVDRVVNLCDDSSPSDSSRYEQNADGRGTNLRLPIVELGDAGPDGGLSERGDGGGSAGLGRAASFDFFAANDSFEWIAELTGNAGK